MVIIQRSTASAFILYSNLRSTAALGRVAERFVKAALTCLSISDLNGGSEKSFREATTKTRTYERRKLVMISNENKLVCKVYFSNDKSSQRLVCSYISAYPNASISGSTAPPSSSGPKSTCSSTSTGSPSASSSASVSSSSSESSRTDTYP